MLRIETSSITLLLSCVSVVSPLSTFHPKTYSPEWFVRCENCDKDRSVCWWVGSSTRFWRRLIIDDTISLSFETFRKQAKQTPWTPPLSAWIVWSSKSKSFQSRYPTQTIISLHPPRGIKKSCCALYYCITLRCYCCKSFLALREGGGNKKKVGRQKVVILLNCWSAPVCKDQYSNTWFFRPHSRSSLQVVSHLSTIP